jgi:diguanylate cyclase (GGDEF)-like protein
VPLLTEGVALGVLHLQGDADALTPRKRSRAQELADFCGMLCGSLRLRELLSDQAIRDPLTRLYNRRHMEESLRRELAARSQRPVGVIMIDIDHFKKFNSKFNHEGGNELLRAFGTFLQNQVRPGDIACRYGGEEFMLILPGATLEASTQRAEKIRTHVKHLHVKHHDRCLGPITLSLGVAASTPGSQANELVDSAATALKQAKETGRNRVVVARSQTPRNPPHFRASRRGKLV